AVAVDFGLAGVEGGRAVAAQESVQRRARRQFVGAAVGRVGERNAGDALGRRVDGAHASARVGASDPGTDIGADGFEIAAAFFQRALRLRDAFRHFVERTGHHTDLVGALRAQAYVEI